MAEPKATEKDKRIQERKFSDKGKIVEKFFTSLPPVEKKTQAELGA